MIVRRAQCVSYLTVEEMFEGTRGAGFSGVTMQRMRLPGNERTSYRQIFPSSLLAEPNLEDEIPFKGGRFVTP
jgi:hypothetical protein